MPWSPLQYTEEIFKNLKRKGYIREVTPNVLHTEIMRATGMVKGKTIGNTIRAFEKLGYIKLLDNGFFRILYWKEEETENEKSENDLLDKYDFLVSE